MRRTYAYNSILFGILIGMLVGVSTDNAALAVLAGLGVSIVGFIAIRLIENALCAGVDMAVDKMTGAHQRRKAQQNPIPHPQPNVTRMPVRTVPPVQPVRQTQPGEPMTRCPFCGASIRRSASFCKYCGGAVRQAQ